MQINFLIKSMFPFSAAILSHYSCSNKQDMRLGNRHRYSVVEEISKLNKKLRVYANSINRYCIIITVRAFACVFQK